MKKLFVVVVSDNGHGFLEGAEVLHIRATDPGQATECAKDIFIEEYGYNQEFLEENADFSTYEFREDEIIDA